MCLFREGRTYQWREMGSRHPLWLLFALVLCRQSMLPSPSPRSRSPSTHHRSPSKAAKTEPEPLKNGLKLKRRAIPRCGPAANLPVELPSLVVVRAWPWGSPDLERTTDAADNGWDGCWACCCVHCSWQDDP